MLFNSVEFIFFFLPTCLFLYFSIAKRFGNEKALSSLIFCSLFFYAWWSPVHLLLLLFSMAFNYSLGSYLNHSKNKSVLIFGIGANLFLIGYFKYANFLVDNVGVLVGTQFEFDKIVLPLAISFFTFQQIAYLVDSYRGITREYKFGHYALFVSFFPQLIAGPIVHHKQMMPQFESQKSYAFDAENFAIGISIFAVGLFKKAVLADGVAIYANPVFHNVDNGVSVDFFSAWGGALAYSFQLYFDFSGYSDMAIGLARMFGIVLPLNFYSPYKATSISEFWRRWHITLSTFLRDYIYIPLGGNRVGQFRRYNNLMITMLLGGLWHGAGWNFVIWGGLHGLYLAINSYWQVIATKYSFAYRLRLTWLSWLLTFLAVVVGWVFFRATTLDGALNMLSGMAGLNGVAIPNAIFVRLGSLTSVLTEIGISPGQEGGAAFVKTWSWIVVCFILTLSFPNVYELFSKYNAALAEKGGQFGSAFTLLALPSFNFTWKMNVTSAYICGILFAFGLLTLSQVSEFLYFQF
ncbi:MBOAT family O-acyltransferase [Alteromonas lipolytica]|uniref:Probable alginate O-acetylase n=1 Tax=Alteromonas lipolytica TaxID=1856405 RepID=A0A1E8FDQ1_9ALTE|nr:MBOAT family protein [Alteromonas lipolytica]OFI34065.1 alginate O-acetyltransferase [Alteromonas lipolytica]